MRYDFQLICKKNKFWTNKQFDTNKLTIDWSDVMEKKFM